LQNTFLSLVGLFEVTYQSTMNISQYQEINVINIQPEPFSGFSDFKNITI